MKNKSSVESNLIDLISKIGEKITIRRACYFDDSKGKNYFYIHNSIEKNIGKIISVVTLSNMNNENIGAIFAMVFILVGLAFKVSAVPFHMWTPDVYEGSPSSVTAFFAIVPKIAGIAIFIRFLQIPFFQLIDQWQTILVFVSLKLSVSNSTLPVFISLRSIFFVFLDWLASFDCSRATFSVTGAIISSSSIS